MERPPRSLGDCRKHRAIDYHNVAPERGYFDCFTTYTNDSLRTRVCCVDLQLTSVDRQRGKVADSQRTLIEYNVIVVEG